MIENNIKENIKEKRERLGISQRELARRIEMSGQMISKIESGSTSPSIETLQLIANALEVSIKDLLEDNTEYDFLTGENNENRKFYIDFISHDDKSKMIIALLRKNGYELHLKRNDNKYRITISKEDNYISMFEQDFLKEGKQMLNDIDKYIRFSIDEFIKQFPF